MLYNNDTVSILIPNVWKLWLTKLKFPLFVNGKRRRSKEIKGNEN
jgi:hypothetical protein